ncbi:MAG: hypothetical protein U1F43_17085 [Myxococcota bacterium]
MKTDPTRLLRRPSRRALGRLGPLLLVGLAPACSEREPSPPTTGFAIAVAPLELPGIVEATFDLSVENGDGQVVWSATGLTSTHYGSGRGDLSYVGTCDPSAQPNRVLLDVVSIEDDQGPLGDDAWVDPTRDGPLVIERDCVENADVPVTFDLTILRAARQGFFDVAVEFADVFCSAKLDCQDADGGDLELLQDASGQRRTTVVMGFACTAGGGEATWLHLSDVRVECPPDVTYWIDPTRGPGATGARGDALFATAVYRGREALAGLDKCYWNLALGVAEGEAAADCVLVADGSASPAPFELGHTPPDAVWPIVHWEVPLTDGDGQVSCGREAVNAPASRVTTTYSDMSGATFDHSLACAQETFEGPTRMLCEDTTYGGASPIQVTSGAAGVTISVGGSTSPTYTLPTGRHLGGCCLAATTGG